MSRDRKQLQPQPDARTVANPQDRELETEMEKARQCPCCFGTTGSMGESNGNYAKSSSLQRKYFQCPSCGHTWSVDVRLIIERINNIKQRVPADLSERA